MDKIVAGVRIYELQIGRFTVPSGSIEQNMDLAV